MNRSVALANLLQGGIYVFGWYWLKERWGVPAYLSMGCAVLQLTAAIGLLLQRERWARWCSIICLMAVTVIIGQFLDAANHLTEAYGADAKKIGERSIQTIWLATPWVLFFPLWQAIHGGWKALVGPLVLVFIPLLFGTGGDGPLLTWPEQSEQKAAAEAAFSIWNGFDAEIPTGVGPASVLLTSFENGKPVEAIRGSGSTLKKAVQDALDRLPPPKLKRTALVLDVARRSYTRSDVVPAGDGGGLSKVSGTSPVVAWRPGKMGNKAVAPLWTLPRPKIRGQLPTLFDSVLVDGTGVHTISGAWTEAPILTADTALASAKSAGLMLAYHQQPNGRFAYTVKGPSGNIARSGYNFPRHAGTTWFLARLATRTDDPVIRAAALRGIDYMIANTIEIDEQRKYLGDPRRSDGKAWVGTTALAVLAAVVMEHPMALPWGRFVASSVDESGQVRGEMNRSETVFLPQNKNPYGQGQTTLAVASLVRAGHAEFRPTLERLAAYMDGDYAPGGAGRLVILDEHWTCLAALAVKQAIGVPAGADICLAYLAQESGKTPTAASRIRPFSGSAGGLAEAVIAGTYLDDTYREDALAYGRWFLRSAYRKSDSSLLPNPRALLGGFRDTPYKLDVRMDAVQHIGCALLGVEALLSTEHPGSLP